VQFTRRTVAGFFGLPAELVSCHHVDVGGMFGVRGEVYPEDFLVPWAARLTGRPVKWVEDRREHLMSINQSRDHRHEIEIAASRTGELLGYRVRGDIDVGAYPRPIGGRLPQNAVGSLPGPYRWQAFEAVCRGVASNKPPSGTMRAPSSFEVIYVMERAVDMVAAELGLDPLDLRRRNLIPASELPLTVPMGPELPDAHYDGGDYPEQLSQFLERTDFAEVTRAVRRRRAAGERVGIGWAMYVDHSGGGKEETVRLTLDTTGRFELGTTATDFGQGLEEMALSVLTRELDVDESRVEVLSGDTTAHDGGNGTFASRSTIFVGSAARAAAGQLMTQAADRAAGLLGCAPDTLARTRTGFTAGGESVDWKELAPIEVIGYHQMDHPTHGFGIALCVATLDAETARPTIERFIVGYDAGVIIDPPSALGQVKGAVAMGLGGTLLESLRFAADGQPLSTTFMDYLIPTAEEIPDVEAHVFEMEAVPGNPLGVRGMGEAGIKGVGAAVTNAVADAIGSAARFALTELPIRPDVIAELVPLDWAAPPPSAQAAEPEAAEPERRRAGRAGVAAGALGLAAVAALIGWRLARRRREQ
jgi:aerobic carbon-monoxide dehydrogenase large subunit